MTVATPPHLPVVDGGSLLRFITCGSVDDGKSTLIGRLLAECGAVPEDQILAATRDSERFGTQAEGLDYALLLDGLSAEREQGITIDVAYRYFSAGGRRFIVADTPGHAQYTRNMVTGASTADLAVILIDARRGVTTQTRRHGLITHLLGVRSVILAVNKMDLVGWSEAVFQAIVSEYRAFAAPFGLDSLQAIPVSAVEGDNLVRRGVAEWYGGPSILEHLIQVQPRPPGEAGFRMPVQWINRPTPDFRGVCGMISSGRAAPGDRIRVLPSGVQTTIKQIAAFHGPMEEAGAGRSTTLVLEDDVDVSRGDVLVAAADPLEVSDQFEVTLIWMDEQPLIPNRRYLFKRESRTVNARITRIKHVLNVDNGDHLSASVVHLNEIAACNLALDAGLPFAPYSQDRALGAFILIDRESNATAAAGLIHFALRRASNVHRQALDVSRAQRSERLGQKPCVLWFTGLSGAGKSTIANAVERRLQDVGLATILLDGDNLRHGLNKDLGFTEADRAENLRRTAEVAKLMTEAGLIVLSALISPFRSDREAARALFEPGEYLEIHVDVPLALAEVRDPKGLYAKARAGRLSGFTGVDSAYEPPETPELRLDTSALTVEDAAEAVITILSERGFLEIR